MRGGERLKSPQQYVEWCNLEHMPLIQLHLFTNLSPPHQSRQNIGSEMPIFHRDSFPPGEAKGR